MTLVPGLGLRFIAEIERCQQALLETPLMGHPYGRRLRKFKLGDKFPYSIVYAVLADVLFVVAYAHGSRRPSYWRVRVVR
jgi:toxin ParE1/3/4